jgi:hypothetical protein
MVDRRMVDSLFSSVSAMGCIASVIYAFRVECWANSFNMISSNDEQPFHAFFKNTWPSFYHDVVRRSLVSSSLRRVLDVEWFSQFGNDICRAWLWLSAAFEFSTARQDPNHNTHNMAAPARQTTAIPGFLLPQISWPARASRPVALGTLAQGRHRFCVASERRAVFPKPSSLQAQTATLWPKTSPQYASGYASALEFRRSFSATARQSKDHHFDTLKFVQRLKEEGFTEEQAEGMMRVLSDVIEER